jgi:RNA polymerase sigma-70 factor (ECF subfamily)
MFGNKQKKYKLKTDEELVTLYKLERSSTCIAIIYERYGHLVMGTCMKYLKNEVESQDITMQIFEELHSKLLKHEINYFKSWLYMVTKNECFMFLRKSKSQNTTDFSESYDVEQTIEDVQAKEKSLELLENAIEDLKPEQKRCVKLFYLEEKSYQQISAELNLSLMQVKSAIQNGKRNIKLQLEKQDEFKKD